MDGIIKAEGTFASCLVWSQIILILEVSLLSFKVGCFKAEAEERFGCYLCPPCRSQIY